MKPTFPLALFLLFLGLKLGGAIDWSWWWVFAPIWGVALLIFIITFIVGFYVAYTKEKRRLWIAPVDHWYIALQEMTERRHKLSLPLKSHGYLYEILAGLADKNEAVAEKKQEETRRHRQPASTTARTVADITGDLNHFKNMVEASSNEAVKAAMQQQVDRCQAELGNAKGGNIVKSE